MVTQLDTLIEKWCGGSVRSSGPGSLVVQNSHGEPLKIRAETVSDAEAELRATWTPPSTLASDAATISSLAQAAMMMRSALLRCEARDGRVEIRMPLYLEGLSRQEFLNAVAEVGRAHWVLASSAAELEAQQEILKTTRLSEADLDAALEQVQRAQRELEARENAEREAASAAAATQPGGGWAVTHVVPDGGMPAWTTPDGSAAPAVALAAGVELQLQDQRGDWALVMGSNGWSGWVDARRLLPR